MVIGAKRKRADVSPRSLPLSQIGQHYRLESVDVDNVFCYVTEYDVVL